MPDIGTGNLIGDALLRAFFTERGQLIGEGVLLAVVSPLQSKLIGEGMLLAIVDQVFAATSDCVQLIKGDVQWIDQ